MEITKLSSVILSGFADELAAIKLAQVQKSAMGMGSIMGGQQAVRKFVTSKRPTGRSGGIPVKKPTPAPPTHLQTSSGATIPAGIFGRAAV